MKHRDWSEFYNRTKGKPPRDLITKAVKYTETKENAADLGAGALRDSKFLLDQGFSVKAIDNSPLFESLVSGVSSPSFSYHNSDLCEFNFETEKYDIINAMCTLPYVPQNEFRETFFRILDSLKPGGVMSANFYGTDDYRNTPQSQMSFHAKNDIEQILQGLEIILFDTEDRIDSNGKRLQIYSIIAKKTRLIQ